MVDCKQVARTIDTATNNRKIPNLAAKEVARNWLN